MHVFKNGPLNAEKEKLKVKNWKIKFWLVKELLPKNSLSEGLPFYPLTGLS